MLPEQCHRLRVTAKAAHFLGQLPQRSKLSHYFKLHVSWYLNPYSTSGYQVLSNKPSESKEMAALKTLGILMWNIGSDIKRHEVQSSMIVLIAVAADL